MTSAATPLPAATAPAGDRIIFSGWVSSVPMSMSSKRKGEAPPFAALEAELERLAQRGGELTRERETAAAEFAAARAHLAMTLIGKGDVSAAETRSLSSFIEKVLTDHLRARGYLPKQQAAR